MKEEPLIPTIKQYLKENLSIELNFNRYEYGGNNQLEVYLKLDDEVISKNMTTINPVEENYL